MNFDQLLEALLGSQTSFESALSQVRDVDAGELLIGLLDGLDKTDEIENVERERRLASIFPRVSPSASHLTSVGEAGASLKNPVLRNGLTQLLPPEYRSLVFRGKRAQAPAPPRREDKKEAEDATQLIASTEEHQASFSDVIVLSIVDDPATKKLLEKEAFVPLRCHSIDEFQKMIATNEEICGFLVEASFLSSLDHSQQDALIENIARFSTFVWLRFQEDGLIADNLDVSQIISDKRCRTSPPDVTELSFRDRPGLQERELSSLLAARKRLLEGEAYGLFVPGAVSSLELKLLGAAMSQYSKRRRFNPGAELTEVTTKFLQGGETDARVALVKVNDLRMPVIVKLDEKEAILDEARRFLTFIHKIIAISIPRSICTQAPR